MVMGPKEDGFIEVCAGTWSGERMGGICGSTDVVIRGVGVDVEEEEGMVADGGIVVGEAAKLTRTGDVRLGFTRA